MRSRSAAPAPLDEIGFHTSFAFWTTVGKEMRVTAELGVRPSGSCLPPPGVARPGERRPGSTTPEMTCSVAAAPAQATAGGMVAAPSDLRGSVPLPFSQRARSTTGFDASIRRLSRISITQRRMLRI